MLLKTNNGLFSRRFRRKRTTLTLVVFFSPVAQICPLFLGTDEANMKTIWPSKHVVSNFWRYIRIRLRPIFLTLYLKYIEEEAVVQKALPFVPARHVRTYVLLNWRRKKRSNLFNRSALLVFSKNKTFSEHRGLRSIFSAQCNFSNIWKKWIFFSNFCFLRGAEKTSISLNLLHR